MSFRVLLAVMCALAACDTRMLGKPGDEPLRSPSSALDFGEVFVGGEATARLPVTNPTRTSARLVLALEPPFEAPGPLEVPGGTSIEVPLVFRPVAPGVFHGTLTLGPQVVTLTGVGLEAPICPPVDVCSTAAFDPQLGQCVAQPHPDGDACQSRCVTSGVCAAGRCFGAFVDCDDRDVCTDDSCAEPQGCRHLARVCPATPGDACRVPACRAPWGCVFDDAPDGTACGERNCQNNTTRVCVLGQCVDRPLPTPECLVQYGYIKASNTQALDAFGSRVALSADGTTLAVGTLVEASAATGVGGDEADNSAPQSGAVYVFKRSGSTWVQEAYVKASNTGAGDSFGFSVALSADGETLVVGAHLEDSGATGVGGNQADDSQHDSGAVYVFVRSAGTWAQTAFIKASNTEQGDRFGASVAVSGDGTVIAVGAAGEDSGGTGLSASQLDNSADEAGAVYVFRRRPAAWGQEQYVKPSSLEGGDLFGSSVALSEDGATLAVSALGEDSAAVGVDGDASNDGAPQSGAVYVFRRGPVAWSQQAYVKAPNTGAGDVFGIGIALSSDGSTLAVGAYGEDSSATGVNGDWSDNAASQGGAAYVYRGPAWRLDAYLKAHNTGGGDSFGFSVALSGDGTTVAVGAFGEDSSASGIDGHGFNDASPESGAVFVFRRGATRWAQRAYVKASNTGAGDVFGHSLALAADGDTLACSAPGEDSRAKGVGGNQADDSANDSGAVYVFSTR